jgi:hypothetical protein
MSAWTVHAPGSRTVVPDDPSTQELQVEQVQRELRERSNAEQAPTEAGERAAERRADKAAYLKRKLEQQQEADEQSGDA